MCVRVHCAGVNPVDTYIRSGLVSQQSLPFIAGSDGAGVVEECGSAVTKFKVAFYHLLLYHVLCMASPYTVYHLKLCFFIISIRLHMFHKYFNIQCIKIKYIKYNN